MSRKFPIYVEDLEKTPEYFCEKLRLDAHELIWELMEKEHISKKELADRMGQSKPHITALLSE